MNRLDQQIRFIVEIDKLKEVVRRSPLMSGGRYENSAEHSWHLAMMALLLSEHANEPVNVAHVVKLVLIHDIVEIDAGDTFAYDALGHEDKAAREQIAADRLFGLLPSDQAAELMALWHEFEARETAEAKFANALDRCIPLLHNYHNQGHSWQANAIRKEQVVNLCQKMDDGSHALWQMALGLVDEAAENGWLSA